MKYDLSVSYLDVRTGVPPFWEVTPYVLKETCQNFGGTWCLYLQDTD